MCLRPWLYPGHHWGDYSALPYHIHILSNSFSELHECDRQTDRQTDIAAAFVTIAGQYR